MKHGMSHKKVGRTDLLNGWLKYHNTTVEEVIKNHLEEVLKSPDWFKLYPCTRQQYEEWVLWAKDLIKKTTKCSNVLLDHDWPWIYLDSSPYVIKEDEKDTIKE